MEEQLETEKELMYNSIHQNSNACSVNHQDTIDYFSKSFIPHIKEYYQDFKYQSVQCVPVGILTVQQSTSIESYGPTLVNIVFLLVFLTIPNNTSQYTIQ